MKKLHLSDLLTTQTPQYKGVRSKVVKPQHGLARQSVNSTTGTVIFTFVFFSLLQYVNHIFKSFYKQVLQSVECRRL